jgi:hypothetical protein
VVAIALVSFFGLQFKVFEEIVPVEKIEILNKDLEYEYMEADGSTTIKKDKPYVFIKPNANGEYVYQIDYHVYPDNATNKKVDFSFDQATTKGVTVSEDGLVRFDTSVEGYSKAVTIYITPNDNGDFKTQITIAIW